MKSPFLLLAFERADKVAFSTDHNIVSHNIKMVRFKGGSDNFVEEIQLSYNNIILCSLVIS